MKINLDDFNTGIISVDNRGIVTGCNSRGNILIPGCEIGGLWSDIYMKNLNVEASGLYYSVEDGGYVGLEINQASNHQYIIVTDYTKLVDIIEAKAKTMRLMALGEMAGSISHQIKTPLLVASMQVEMLEEETDNKRLNKIMNSLDTIRVLLDEMLIFSTENKVEGVSSHELIIELMRSYPDVNIKKSGKDVGFVGNSKMIINMMSNLINNSVETGFINPKINIKSKPNGAFCEIIYSDNCGGVDPEIDIFSRNQSTKVNGSGIGMNVVKFIVEAHGGYINYKKKTGEGIMININIPLEKSMQGGK